MIFAPFLKKKFYNKNFCSPIRAFLRRGSSFFCLTALVFLVCGCGIDEYIYLEPIIAVSSIPEPTNTDESINQFTFQTRDAANASSEYYRGCEVYYRIYNNATTLISDRTAIQSYNDNTDTNANIFSYLTSTKKYSRLCYIPAGSSSVDINPPLIAAANANRDVVIRFITTAAYTQGIYVDGESIGVPVRNYDALDNTDYITFDKFIDDESDSEKKNDDDVQYSSSFTETGVWYINAYAFSYGVNDSFSGVYSTAAYLGAVRIEED